MPSSASGSPEAGLEPAPRADKRTLIRRATYDLTGLPPTAEEVEAFLGDDGPGAWERLIDRLLASPRYGEQWGRHWLDAARYADTSGYSNDWERSNAWRYRDYVIRSFNEDKPYDQFVVEQVAGDELDPDDPEMMVATGFLRSGPWEHTAMTPESVSRQLYLDDVVNNVGQALLSTPLRCAKCHDHKFDRSRRATTTGSWPPSPPRSRPSGPRPFLPSENTSRFEEGRAEVETLLAWAKADVAKIQAKEERAGRAWAEERGIPYIPRTNKNNDVPEDQKPPRHVRPELRGPGLPQGPRAGRPDLDAPPGALRADGPDRLQRRHPGPELHDAPHSREAGREGEIGDPARVAHPHGRQRFLTGGGGHAGRAERGRLLDGRGRLRRLSGR